MKAASLIMASLVSLMLAAAPAQALDCPNVIQYAGGGYLKYGETFYYPNGNYLKYGSTLYYQGGNYLKYGSTLYYQNGNYLQYGSTLYYPNGSYLKYGSTIYYANGNYLQYGTTFYHPNGQYARYGTTLYRDDGSTTAFPITLREEIPDHGSVVARVESNRDDVNIRFNRLTSDSDLVRLTAYWDGTTFSDFTFRIGTGAAGETVVLTVRDGTYDCHLDAGGGGPTRFSISENAAFVDVEVNGGYDPDEVRRVLVDALRSLDRR